MADSKASSRRSKGAEPTPMDTGAAPATAARKSFMTAGTGALPAAATVATSTPTLINYDLCCACGAGGDLICCDSCPNSFHLDCLEPALEKVPAGSWYCNACYTTKHAPPHGVAAMSNKFFGKLIDSLTRDNPQVFHLPPSILSRKRKRGFSYGTKVTRVLGAAGRPLAPAAARSVLDLPARQVNATANQLEKAGLSVIERSALAPRSEVRSGKKSAGGAGAGSEAGANGAAAAGIVPDDSDALNVSWCCKCSAAGGPLLPCDLCCRSFHPECVGLERGARVSDSWVCPNHNDLDVYAARVREFVLKKQKTAASAGSDDGAHGFVDDEPVTLDFGLSSAKEASAAPRRVSGRTARVTVPGITPFATGATPSVAEQNEWVAALESMRSSVAEAVEASQASAAGEAVAMETDSLQTKMVGLMQEQMAMYRAAMGEPAPPAGAALEGRPVSALALQRVLSAEFVEFLAWQRLNQLTARVHEVQAELLQAGEVPVELATAAAGAAAGHPLRAPAVEYDEPVAFLATDVVTLPLTGNSVVVGRAAPGSSAAPDLDLSFLNGSSSVSRKHAAIVQSKDGFTLLNYAKGGTRVNGVLVADEPIALASNDVVSFGKLEFRFRVAGAHAGQA
ncbi:uncharacterized protein AMSG_00421 [Thecamonas trahens ATCC 50062]|uniref:Uncharacterized protein n=1 Tax=Thecamonas trahens ATCC 50062 TaxID=461836 RepID=A0A0L0D8I0_THETB|nr:hypothetical protein AMSG_00421 [Thecamonas trahens ATCC 50062]KNC48644.1 hypothetical protein AMSG_00421 [Thecamonas trahens ATCC 50062]|eukprot:XP_013762700.1 hypothetical protein AMSG_00421 [Thecamonas trahens ATCC 50062]